MPQNGNNEISPLVKVERRHYVSDFTIVEEPADHMRFREYVDEMYEKLLLRQSAGLGVPPTLL